MPIHNHFNKPFRHRLPPEMPSCARTRNSHQEQIGVNQGHSIVIPTQPDPTCWPPTSGPPTPQTVPTSENETWHFHRRLAAHQTWFYTAQARTSASHLLSMRGVHAQGGRLPWGRRSLNWFFFSPTSPSSINDAILVGSARVDQDWSPCQQSHSQPSETAPKSFIIRKNMLISLSMCDFSVQLFIHNLNGPPHTACVSGQLKA